MENVTTRCHQGNDIKEDKMKWIKGTPPEFEERTWIIAQIPSLFNPNAFRYQAFIWDMKWHDREILRATQWAILPLPEER